MTLESDKLGLSGRIAAFFQSSQLTPLLALVLLLAGVFAVAITPKEEEPQIDVTMANVFIPFPGASAQDVESLVTTPAEQVLSQITGIEHLYSVTRPGMAVLTVQFKVGEDRTAALVRLHDTLASHRDWVSPYLGVGEPIVKPKGIDDVPIVTLTLWTEDETRGAYELQQVAHSMEIELKRVAGTKAVYTIGGPERAVRVLMDPERMNAHGVTAQDVRNALLLSNASQPTGRLFKENQEILVQTGTWLAGSADVKQLVVSVRQGRPVFIADVAEVSEGPAPPNRYAWFGTGPAAKSGAAGPQPAVTLAISKKAGENAATIAQRVIARVAQLEGTVIPEGINVNVTRDYGATASEKAAKLMQKLAFATASVVILVFFTLGRREALIVGVAVGLTLAATLFASWAWGFTLNRVSLFALIFSIGILVDDAIVVVENIHRHRGLSDRPLSRIIPAAVDEVGGPTILATFTVIAALLPMAFVSGLMGPYMSPIPINASIGMLLSLAIAFMVTPWLSLKLLGHGPHLPAPAIHTTRLHRLFSRVLRPFVAGAKARRARLLLGLGVMLLVAVSALLPVAQWVVLKMLPFDNKSEFQVMVDLPTGTPVEQTAAALSDMGAYLATVPEVTTYQAYAGTASPINFNGLVRQYYLRGEGSQGDLQVNLLNQHARSRKSHDIAGAVRAPLEAIAARHGARVKVVEVPPGPPVLSPIVAEIYGPDYQGQMRIAQALADTFSATMDIVGVDDSVDEPAPKIQLRVLQDKAAIAGVSSKDVVDTLTMGLAGMDVTPVHGGNAKYQLPVRISLPPDRQSSLDEFLKLQVRAASGQRVPLSELVQITPIARDATIHHKDLLPVTYVMADMAGALDSPLYGMFAVRSKIAGMTLPEGGTLGEYFIAQPEDPYAGYAVKWDGEWQITYETFRDMGIAYAVGLILIYLLVVAQFRSYLTPLIIMAPIPLTLVGVMPGHALLRAQFTATSMIGMIALAGIIVRNSILLVDFINLEVARGRALADAVIDAAAARAKPIVLTGVAAMLGAFFILDDPIFNGLAISLIFGILVSTLLTLVVIPVLYFALRARHSNQQVTSFGPSAK